MQLTALQRLAHAKSNASSRRLSARIRPMLSPDFSVAAKRNLLFAAKNARSPPTRPLALKRKKNSSLLRMKLRISKMISRLSGCSLADATTPTALVPLLPRDPSSTPLAPSVTPPIIFAPSATPPLELVHASATQPRVHAL